MNEQILESYQEVVLVLSQLLLEENKGLRDSMQRIDSLLKHAVELLNESLFSVNSTIVQQQNTLSGAMMDEVQNEEQNSGATAGQDLLFSLKKALSITIKLNAILSKTTRSLQVEDIVSQIVSHVVQRTMEIDEALIKIKKIPALNNAHEREQLLNEIKDGILKIHESTGENHVKQKNLNEGDIDLF